MPEPLVTDAFWEIVEPLLPAHAAHPRGGRPFVDDRACLAGILFVLKTGIAWADLPAHELGCGCGMTCWRRLRDWRAAGAWRTLHELLLARLHALGGIDLARAVVDSSSIRALKKGTRPARTRRTAAGPARNTTSWPTRTAARWRRRSRARTATT